VTLRIRTVGGLAVSTLVLAALAVSESAACPLGREIDLEHPVLPWLATPIALSVAKPATVALITAVGDGAAIVRTLARVELRCGRGQGEATVRIHRGQATVTTTGLDPVIADCVRAAYEDVRFTRVANDTIARVRVAF
jgi:hypothetical protein